MSESITRRTFIKGSTLLGAAAILGERRIAPRKTNDPWRLL